MSNKTEKLEQLGGVNVLPCRVRLGALQELPELGNTGARILNLSLEILREERQHNHYAIASRMSCNVTAWRILQIIFPDLTQDDVDEVGLEWLSEHEIEEPG